MASVPGAQRYRSLRRFLMSPDREPTDAEREAAVRHHQETCAYWSDSECPLNDSDPLDRYLPEGP